MFKCVFDPPKNVPESKSEGAGACNNLSRWNCCCYTVLAFCAHRIMMYCVLVSATRLTRARLKKYLAPTSTVPYSTTSTTKSSPGHNPFYVG